MGERVRIGNRFELRRETRHDGRARWYETKDVNDGAAATLRLLRTHPNDNLDRWYSALRKASGMGGVIVSVLSAGRLDDGTPWVATKPISSYTLEDALASGAAKKDVAMGALGAVARALSELHDTQIAYGELDPSRVLLSPNGPMLLEPTVPWPFDAKHSVTIEISLYMAPEGRGMPADVFALAAMVHEVLAGRLPYADREALIDGRMSPGTLPRHLVGAIRSALAPDPTVRPKMRDLAAMLATASVG